MPATGEASTERVQSLLPRRGSAPVEPDDGVEATGRPGSELDVSSVRGRESPDDREAQAEAIPPLVCLPEAVEGAISLCLAQTGTLVDDVQLHPAVGGAGGDGDRSTGRGRVDRSACPMGAIRLVEIQADATKRTA